MVPYANRRGLDGGFSGRHYMAMSRHPLTNDQIHPASNSFLNKCRKCQIIWGHGNKCKQIGRLIDITYLWICSKYCIFLASRALLEPYLFFTLYKFYWPKGSLLCDWFHNWNQIVQRLVVLLVAKEKTIKMLNSKSFVVWREIAWARQRRIKYNVKAEEKISVWNRLHICLKILKL